jgi:transcriptional regulator with XRE-family HTH domain
VKGNAIREELKVRGHSFSALAKLLGLSTMQVSRVAHRSRTNHRVALAIATALDKPIDEVFPDKREYHRVYMPDAQRQQLLARQLRDQNLIEQRV